MKNFDKQLLKIAVFTFTIMLSANLIVDVFITSKAPYYAIVFVMVVVTLSLLGNYEKRNNVTLSTFYKFVFFMTLTLVASILSTIVSSFIV